MLEKLIDKKVSLRDAMLVIPWIGLLYLLKTVDTQTTQLLELKELLARQTLELTLLQKEYSTMNEASMELKRMVSLQGGNNTSSAPVQTADLMIAQNEMTQFYLKYIGIAIIAGVTIYVVGSVIAPTSFTIKALIPARLLSLIQDNTPFYQTVKTYTSFDRQNHLTWMVNIYNEKRPEILIKPENGNDFQLAGEYITQLMSNAGTLARLSNAQPETQAAAVIRAATEVVQAAVPDVLQVATPVADMVAHTMNFV